MLWLALVYGVLICWSCFVEGRQAPYYDLDDGYYTDIKDILEEHLAHKSVDHPREVRGWGLSFSDAEIAGVAVDGEGRPVIFHRGSRFWDYDTFNETEHLQFSDPIPEAVVMTLDAQTGQVVSSWGKAMFFLPHGITIDHNGNTWLTDVGAHQVFKFSPESKTTPVLTLGERLQPGSDKKHFCKPTSVAVTKTGDFYVADGYCNYRVLFFSKDGELKAEFGQYGEDAAPSSLAVPHGLTLNEALDILCLADRENGRVVCIRAGLEDAKRFGEKATALIYEPNQLRVFDIAFVGSGLVGVAGSEVEGGALGFTANLDQGQVVDQWQPIQGFYNPHSIVVDEKRQSMYVSETGPNRVWKFILDSKKEIQN